MEDHISALAWKPDGDSSRSRRLTYSARGRRSMPFLQLRCQPYRSSKACLLGRDWGS